VLTTRKPLRRDLKPLDRPLAPWKEGQIPAGRIDTSALRFGVSPRIRETIKPHEDLAIRKGFTRCEWCGDEIPLPQEPHHIVSRGAGGPDHQYNLMMLCGKRATPGTCHGDAHGKCRPKDRLTQEMLAERHALLFDEIRDGAHLLEEINRMRTRVNKGA
jgi:hypothetical protein